MKTLLLAGYYGKGNAGDDAFVDVAGWGLGRLYPTVKTKGTLAGSLTLPSCTLPGIYYARCERVWLWLGTRDVDAVLFAGGSNFHSSHLLKRWSDVLRRNSSCRFAGIGVSIGPFNDTGAEHACRHLLNRFAYLGVRDQQSYRRLQQMGVSCPYELTFDLAVQERFIQNLPVIRSPRRDRVLGVSLCYYERYTGQDRAVEERRLVYLARLIKEALTRQMFERVILFSFNRHPTLGDDELLGRLRTLAGSDAARISIRRYDGNPVSLMQAIGEVAAMIATRLHAAVFAYTMETPCLTIPYHEKSWEWMRMIHEDKYIDVSETSPSHGVSLLKELLHGNNENLLPVCAASDKSQSNWHGLARYF